MNAYSVLLSHHQPSREPGTEAGILKPRDGKHDTAALAADFELGVGMRKVLLNRNKG